VRLWDWQTQHLHAEFRAVADSLRFSPDGLVLAAGGKSLYLWSLAKNRLRYQNFHADRGVSAFYPLVGEGVIFTAGRKLAVWGLVAGDLALTPLEDDRVGVGADLYIANGCNGCHFEYPSGAPTLYGIAEVAGTRIENMSAEDYLYQAIVNPDAYIVDGYPCCIHPSHYGEVLRYEDVQMLVVYLMSLEARD
jgi:hypothetical protein